MHRSPFESFEEEDFPLKDGCDSKTWRISSGPKIQFRSPTPLTTHHEYSSLFTGKRASFAVPGNVNHHHHRKLTHSLDACSDPQLSRPKLPLDSHVPLSPFLATIRNGKRIRMKRKSLDPLSADDIHGIGRKQLAKRRTSLPELSPTSKGIMKERKDRQYESSREFVDDDWVSHGLGKLGKIREKMEILKKKLHCDIPISQKIQMGIVPQNTPTPTICSKDDKDVKVCGRHGRDDNGGHGCEASFDMPRTSAVILSLPSGAPLRRKSFDDRSHHLVQRLEKEHRFKKLDHEEKEIESKSNPSKKRIVVVIPSVSHSSK
jgi:hypothetical protein